MIKWVSLCLNGFSEDSVSICLNQIGYESMLVDSPMIHGPSLATSPNAFEIQSTWSGSSHKEDHNAGRYENDRPDFGIRAHVVSLSRWSPHHPTLSWFIQACCFPKSAYFVEVSFAKATISQLWVYWLLFYRVSWPIVSLACNGWVISTHEDLHWFNVGKLQNRLHIALIFVSSMMLSMCDISNDRRY